MEGGLEEGTGEKAVERTKKRGQGEGKGKVRLAGVKEI